MAFTWNSVSAGTKANSADINEAKTNVDTLATNLGISQYSWVEMATSVSDEITAAQVAELQDAVDYIDTNNVCTAYNAALNSTVYSDRDSTVDSNQNGTADATYHGTDYSSYDNGADNPQYTGVDSNQHATYYATRNASVDATAYATVYNPRNATAK